MNGSSQKRRFRWVTDTITGSWESVTIPSNQCLGLALIITFCIGISAITRAQQDSQEYSSGFCSVLSPDQVETLDSQSAIDPASLLVVRNIQEGLYEYNLQGKPVPLLAEDFPRKLSPGVYLIPLRKGVSFHNGGLLKASDVVFTFNRLKDPEPGVLSDEIFSPIQSITAHDEFTVRVILNTETTDLVELFTRHELYPLSEETVKKTGTGYGWITATGTGPFIFKEWFRGNRVVLVRNNTYWMNRFLDSDVLHTLDLVKWSSKNFIKPILPFLERISITMVPDATQRESRMREGSADVIVNARHADICNFARDKKFVITGIPSTSIVQIYLNTDTPPFINEDLRNAVSLLIDREKLVQDVFNNFAQPASSAIPPWHPAHHPDLSADIFQPDQARTLLASMGITRNSPLTFTLLYTDTLMFEQIALWLQQSLRKYNVQPILKPVPKEELFDFVYGRNGQNRTDFQAALEDWQDWKKDRSARQFIFPLYYSDSPENKVRFGDLEVDRLLQLADTELHQERKLRMYHRLEKLVAKQCSTIVLCVPHVCIVAHPQASGIKLNNTGEIVFRAGR